MSGSFLRKFYCGGVLPQSSSISHNADDFSADFRWQGIKTRVKTRVIQDRVPKPGYQNRVSKPGNQGIRQGIKQGIKTGYQNRVSKQGIKTGYQNQGNTNRVSFLNFRRRKLRFPGKNFKQEIRKVHKNACGYGLISEGSKCSSLTNAGPRGWQCSSPPLKLPPKSNLAHILLLLNKTLSTLIH